MKENLNKFVYLFSINTKDNTQINLTSCNHMIRTGEREYYPYSSLNIIKQYFNDSAANYILIEGLLNTKGIDSHVDLEGADFKIYIYNLSTTQYEFYLHYYYAKYELFDSTYFTLKLVPIAYKLHKSLLKHYSRTCRAHFCDKLCNIDIEKFKQAINIISVQDHLISVEHFLSPELYSYEGYVLINNTRQKHYIKSCSIKHIELDADLSLKIKETDQLFAYMVCDKEFSTCCKKFNNAVNFRGEPFAPTYVTLLK